VRRPAEVVSIAAVLLATALGGSAGAAVKKHDVDLTWKPQGQDISAGSDTVVDSFYSYGPPFDDADPGYVETMTPRGQDGDIRTGKWDILFGKGKNRASCKGRYKAELDVVATTETEQTTEYQGRVWIDSCRKSRRLANLEPGKLGDLDGRVICDADSCRGRLDIIGSIRY
jgi:hypothetical protein